MERELTGEAARSLDRKVSGKFGISTLVLMENAGSSVAGEALSSLKTKKRLAIFCGKGNNGGDGLVAARHLSAQGIKPDIFLACGITQVENEAKTNLNILLKLKARVIPLSRGAVKKLDLSKYDLIIDALLGIGLSGQVKGIYADLIRLINSSGTRVISVDIPSGLDADTGKILGSCVRADRTVTFVAKKRGMAAADGPAYCGKIIVADLGIRFPGF
jgi:hydroxyethylthiazole kinase-like uncharacterized protein yjeF